MIAAATSSPQPTIHSFTHSFIQSFVHSLLACNWLGTHSHDYMSDHANASAAVLKPLISYVALIVEKQTLSA